MEEVVQQITGIYTVLEGQFEKCYRMSFFLSEKLVGTLAPDLSNRKISGNLMQIGMHAGGSSDWNYSLVSSLCINMCC